MPSTNIILLELANGCLGDQVNRGSLIEEINATTFVQKTFSSASKVDPAALMTVPPPKPRTTTTHDKPEVLFHPNVSFINIISI